MVQFLHVLYLRVADPCPAHDNMLHVLRHVTHPPAVAPPTVHDFGICIYSPAYRASLCG